MKRIVLLLFLFLSALFSCKAFSFFRNYDVNKGLSQNTILCILQDKSGYMWFGTKDGLNRFDGIQFKIFKNDPENSNSIADNFIRSIIQIDQGDIWIGSEAGISIYRESHGDFIPFRQTTSDSISIQSPVNSILQDKQGMIWIATMFQGVFCYDPKTTELHNISIESTANGVTSNTVWTLFEDASGNIWAGCRPGLMLIDKQTRKTSVYFDDAPNINLWENNEIFTIWEDSYGNLWIGTWAGGLKRFNKNNETYTSYFSHGSNVHISHIRAISHYDDDHIFLGSDDGFYLFNMRTCDLTRIDDDKNNIISDQNITVLYHDYEGGIWIGTYFGGVNYLHHNANKIEYFNPQKTNYQLAGKALSQFLEDSLKNIWIATEDGGVAYFNTQNKEITNINSKLSYHNIHALEIVDNHLWIGTFSRGIDVMDLQSGKIKNHRPSSKQGSLIDNCVFSFCKTKNGELFIGTTAGACMFDKKNHSFIPITSTAGLISDMIEDHEKNIWIASASEGIYKYDPKNGNCKNYRHDPHAPGSIPSNKIIDIYLDSKKRIWFGSEGRGLILYDSKNDRFISFNQYFKYYNQVVHGIADDATGHLWLSTNNGILKFNPDSNTIKRYDKDDGFHINQYNYRSSLKASDGKIYFGGIGGFAAFYPQELIENKNTPKTVISDIELLNKTSESTKLYYDFLQNDKKIKQKYNKASIQVFFACLSYSSPNKNTYKYKLEELDSDWTQTTSTSVSYVNLAPGEYTFRVKSANSDGIWDEEGDWVHITITPPFWKSGLAKALYVLITLFVFYAIYKSLIKRQKLKEKKKMDSFKLEKERESYEYKMDFFTNIAHEIRTPLCLIKAPLENVINANEGSETTKENLLIIERNTDRLLNLINQLLDFKKVENSSYLIKKEKFDVCDSLCNLIYRFTPLANKIGIHIEFNDSDLSLMIMADKDSFVKIVSNLLSNAIKFANARIEVVLELKNNEICISVIDDGPGIPADLQKKVFDTFYQLDIKANDGTHAGSGIGLALTSQLIHLHNGTIEIQSPLENGKGCCFRVILPQGFDQTNIAQGDAAFDEEGPLEYIESDEAVNTNLTSGRISILIVEDNQELRNYLVSSLQPSYETYPAANGVEAIERLKNTPVDIVISDILMPEMDGLELTKWIKESDDHCHIPIVLLSAKTTTKSKVDGLSYGANAYLEKPFSFEHLIAQINSLIENKKRLVQKYMTNPLAPLVHMADNNSDEEFLKRLNNVLEGVISNFDFSIEKLAQEMNVSRSYLQRKLKGITGLVPNDYIRLMKLKKAAWYLAYSHYKINEIVYLCGYNNPSYFTKCFHKQFGVLPKEFRNSNKDVKKSDLSSELH